MRNESNPEHRESSLGMVWVICPYPVIARGLEGALKGQARVHLGPEPPPRGQEAPSAVLFCPDEAEDVASEVERLRERAPEAPVLIFGLGVDQRAAKAAFGAGASGYVHAGMGAERIAEAVSLALAGEVVIPKELLMGLVAEETSTGLGALTSRQREILALVAEGLTNAEIARRLYLSEFTIKQHLRHAYKALKVKNRTEAARVWSSGDFVEGQEAGPPPPPPETS